MRPVVRRLPAKRCAPLVPWPSLAPAVGNSRGCAEQVAHRRAGAGLSQPHPHAAVVSRGAGFAPCSCFARLAAARAPGNSRGCAGQVGAPGLCFFPALHARGLFRVRARAGLLFPGAQTGPLFPQARARFVFVPWPGDAVFLYSIKRPQACKAAPPITDCTAFLVYINFMTPVPSLVVCGKGLSFRSGFPHFQPSFPQLPTEFFTACPPSTFKNYVNLQQYNAYKREERGKALFFVNSF